MLTLSKKPSAQAEIHSTLPPLNKRVYRQFHALETATSSRQNLQSEII
jgi:hypothetical protein